MNCEVRSEELAAWLAGSLEPGQAEELAAHAAACSECQRRLRALKETDRLLRALPRYEPSARALWETRAALAAETGKHGPPEIMTLEEVAQFLRVPEEALAKVAGELPSFEIGGQIRVRRARLEEWIAQREQHQTRRNVESRMVRGFRGGLERGGVSWRQR